MRLANHAEWMQRGKCKYDERVQPMHLPARVPIHFLKDPKYAHQKELRAVWQPTTYPIAPSVLTWPELTLFCHDHEPGADRPAHSGVLFEGSTFEDLALQIDDLVFVDCTFHRCRLVYGGGQHAIDRAKYEHSELSLVQSAGAALQLLLQFRASTGPLHEILTDLQACLGVPDRAEDLLSPNAKPDLQRAIPCEPRRL